MNRISNIKVVVYRNEPQTKFLLLKLRGKDRWQFLTGRLGKEEDQSDALVRVLENKLNIADKDIRDIEKTGIVDKISVGGCEMESAVFLVEANGSAPINLGGSKREYEEYNWFEPKETRNKLNFQNQQATFEKVLQKL
ncbi:MAG: NUDIX domain-containing protein [Candidatus Aenigmatarchaeota archaeon]